MLCWASCLAYLVQFTVPNVLFQFIYYETNSFILLKYIYIEQYFFAQYTALIECGKVVLQDVPRTLAKVKSDWKLTKVLDSL